MHGALSTSTNNDARRASPKKAKTELMELGASSRQSKIETTFCPMFRSRAYFAVVHFRDRSSRLQYVEINRIDCFLGTGKNNTLRSFSCKSLLYGIVQLKGDRRQSEAPVWSESDASVKGEHEACSRQEQRKFGVVTEGLYTFNL